MIFTISILQNGVFEMDVIPTKKRRKNAKTVVATATATPSKTDRDADREATSRVASETKVGYTHFAYEFFTTP